MTTREIIKESLKSLLKTKPLKKISVKDICNNAYVSRKTFYTYFNNKFHLIEVMLQDDVIATMYKLRELLPRCGDASYTVLVLEHFYQCFYDNKDFYISVIRGKGRYWFCERLVENIMNVNKELTKKYTKTLPPVEIEYMCYFFAASQAMLLVKWLQEECQRLTPIQIAEYYAKWAMQYWEMLDVEGRLEPHWAQTRVHRRISGH